MSVCLEVPPIMRKRAYVFLVSMLFLHTVLAKNRIDRIEPPYWYANMKSDTFMILLHGKRLDKCEFKLNQEDAKIHSIHKFPNRNYAAIDVVLVNKQFTGDLQFYDDEEPVFKYRILKRSGLRPLPITSSDNMYLLTPDRFANGDTGNDNVEGYYDPYNRDKPKGRHGGDLKGMTDHVDYLKDLGVTSVWVNPVLENNQRVESYHGYAITNHYLIDPRFGTNNQYIEYSNKLRAEGISLVKDMVYNHIGNDHLWLTDIPDSNWINFHDGFKQTNYRAVSLVDPYASKADINQFSDGWFVRTMPDLNQRNHFVKTYLIQNTLWWAETAHLSGIRIDTYAYPDNQFSRELNKTIKANFPNLFIFGEVWEVGAASQAYFSPNNIDGSPDQFLDGVTDFQLYFAIQKWLKEEEGWSSGLGRLYYALAEDRLYSSPQNMVTFVDNHDQDRFYGQIHEDDQKWRNGLLFLLTSRGIPCIYYGTELLFKQTGDHGLLRQDMPGGWDTDKRNVFDAEQRTDEENEAFNFLQTLFKMRIDHKDVFNGNLLHFVPMDGSYAYFRLGKAERMMVILNNSDEDKAIDLNRFAEVLPVNARVQDVFSSTIVPGGQKLIVPAGKYFVGFYRTD